MKNPLRNDRIVCAGHNARLPNVKPHCRKTLEKTRKNGQRTILFEIFSIPRGEAVVPLRPGKKYFDPDSPKARRTPRVVALHSKPHSRNVRVAPRFSPTRSFDQAQDRFIPFVAPAGIFP
jgi:hypothetical protein